MRSGAARSVRLESAREARGEGEARRAWLDEGSGKAPPERRAGYSLAQRKLITLPDGGALGIMLESSLRHTPATAVSAHFGFGSAQ